MRDLLDAARNLRRDRGWWVHGVNGKIPRLEEWQNRRIDPDEEPDEFTRAGLTGIGLNLGASGVADLEADNLASDRALDRLAPPTPCRYRSPSGLSHRLYTTAAGHEEWECPHLPENVKRMLVEVRAGAHQSVVPPSPGYEWVEEGEPSEATEAALYRAARLAAVAGVLHSVRAPGMRHKAAAAVAGWLRRRGVTEEEAVAVVEAVAEAAGDDPHGDGVRYVRDTYARGPDEEVSGLPTLSEVIGEDPARWLDKQLPTPQKAGGSRRGPSSATRLVGLAERMELFHTPGADPELYARVRRDDHHEVLALRSRAFRRHLSHQFYLAEGTATSAQALQEALSVIEAKAMFEGPTIPVHTRIAGDGDTIFLDLANERREVVEITAAGYRIRTDYPIRFRRTRGMLPLPRPEPGGKVTELRPFVNIGSDGDFDLLVGWQVGTYRPTGPYPPLAFHGEQGSAKTTTAGFLRDLVDPNEAPLRSEPREVRDLAISGTNAWLLAFDNLSRIQPWLSDALCRVATGGGLATRELYTDSEEVLFNHMRPVLLTGIEEIITRSDLLDRALILYLPAIKEERRELDAFRSAFEHARPRLLGAFLDGVACALGRRSQVRIKPLPRMADFAKWATAAAPAFGWKDNQFIRHYAGNRESIHELALDGCLIYQPLQKVVGALTEASPEKKGTSTELLEQLALEVDEADRKKRGWPSSPRALSGQLRRLAPNLRAVGIDIEFRRGGHAGSREVTIRKGSVETNSTVSTVRIVLEDADASDPTADANEVDADANDAPTPAPDDGADGADDVPPPSSSCQVTESFPPPATELIASAADLPALQGALTRAETVALDVETTGLNPRQDRVRLVSLSTGEGTWLLDAFAVDPRPLFPILAERRLVGHNLAFDLGMLAPLGFEPGQVEDTMILSQLLHARSGHAPKGFYSLRETANREIGIELLKELQKSDWSGALTAAQLEYAARDSAVLLPLLASQEERIRAEGLADMASIEASCLPAVTWMAAAGAPFDAEAWSALTAAAERTAAELEAELNAAAPKPPGHDLDQGWNWNAPEKVKEALRLAGCELPDTAATTLASTNHPLVALLRRYRTARKLVTSYGESWLKFTENGRVFPSWKQCGSSAGRMSCADPNLQQVPRHERYRKCIAAAPGRVLVRADYSQIELRIAAKVAGDSRMLQAYQVGEDLHTLTARSILGRQDVTKADRQIAKAVVFGLIYGMSSGTLRVYARKDYGVELTEAEAHRYRETFFRTYPGLRRWHLSQPKGEIATRTLADRRRLAVSSFTEKLNTPVQGSGADGMKRALALLWERREQREHAFPVIACHDEIVVECPASDAEAVKAWLRQAMLDGMESLIAPVPVEVEVQVGPTWAG